MFVAGQVGGARRVLVGRDMRPSGVELAAAFADGVRAQGLDVVDLGLASTDLVYFAAGQARRARRHVHRLAQPRPVQRHEAVPGRGPPDRRGHAASREIKAMAADGRARRTTAPPAGSRRSTSSRAFADHVRSFVDRRRPAPAQGRGRHRQRHGRPRGARRCSTASRSTSRCSTASSTAPSRTTRPTRSSPRTCATSRRGCSRSAPTSGWRSTATPTGCSSSTSPAQPLSGSTTTAIVAAGVLEKHPGATILHNCICSKAVPEVVRERGGTPVRTKVGHSFIKAVMAETGAAFGGEHSAHYYFRDNWRADSGSIAALLVLEQLGKAGVPLSELRRPFDRYAASGEINATVDDPAAVIERVAGGLPRRRPGPPRRPHRRPRRLVVQPPGVQHRAPPSTQPRGAGCGKVCRATSPRSKPSSTPH